MPKPDASSFAAAMRQLEPTDAPAHSWNGHPSTAGHPAATDAAS